ncbi:Hsp20/alpha crystallin family protein [Halorubrum halodurans]|uniref:Heat-shock protein Hsp20 n=1 Tax=Halorubrum halodurans TaxID=1383851 RepID=A0A256IS85_9EURY|nr:Hsp20/alpha crystallin family protein [Halorubrum halodurans]OYR59385.1 heat-shock protein Hsp20 [Halorubrum halodurans]
MNGSNPFEEIEQFFGRSPFGEGLTGRRGLRTADVDVAEYDDELVVMADLPGYDREHIDVRVDDDRLTIRAERDAEHEAADGEIGDGSDGRRYLRRERRHESVTRTIDLPAGVDPEGAEATYRNGVLTVTLSNGRDDREDGHRIDVE